MKMGRGRLLPIVRRPAPRLAKSSTALHFLITPSPIGLQFGRFRRWRAGIEVEWRAFFRTKD